MLIFGLQHPEMNIIDILEDMVSIDTMNFLV